MPTFARSIVVHANRDRLFALMQDYDRRLEWDAYLSEARLVDGATASAVGVRAWCVEKESGVGMETVYVSFRPPHRVAVKMTAGPKLLEVFAGSWIYKAIAPNQTQVTFKYHIVTRPRLMRPLLDPLVSAWFAREMGKRLRSLKAIVEENKLA